MIGLPWDGASESLTLRGMTTSKTSLPKWAADVLLDLVGEVVPAVIHGQEDALPVKVRVKALLDQGDGLQELRETLHRVILALEGDQHGVGGREGIDGQGAPGPAGSR